MKPNTFRFTASGSDDFPIDMLRYDRAWPESESDSALLAASDTTRQLVLNSLRPPTNARWASFGWQVGLIQ